MCFFYSCDAVASIFPLWQLGWWMKVSFGPWQLCNRHRWLEKIEITSTMHHTVSWTHKSFLNIQEKKLTYIHKPFHSLSFSLSIYLSTYLSIYKEENCRRGATWEEEEREQEGKEGDIREGDEGSRKLGEDGEERQELLWLFVDDARLVWEGNFWRSIIFL